MPTLLSLTKKRDEALAAVAASSSPKDRDKAVKALDAATLKLAAFQARLESKSVKKTKKEETYEEDDGDEDEEESEEDADDEPKKPASDEDDDSDDDSDDDGDDDDDDGDDDDSEEDEEGDAEEDEDADEDEEEEEEEDEKARASAITSARSVLKVARRSGNKALVTSAKASLRSLKRAVKPRAMSKLRTFKAECQRLTGKRSVRAILGAVAAMAATSKNAEAVSARVEKLEATNRRTRVDSMLRDARRDGKITKPMAKSLRAQGLSDPRWLKGYLDTLPKQVRRLEEGALQGRSEDGGRDGEARRTAKLDLQSMSAEQRKLVELAAMDAGKSVDDFVAEMNKTAAKSASNGAAPRQAQ